MELYQFIKYLIVFSNFPDMLIKEEALFFAACGGLTLGFACTLNYVIRGKETGMTRIAYNIATMKKCNTK
jgi:hypothetical protein